MTKLEEQDNFHRSHGFQAGQDYEYPEFTEEEVEIFRNFWRIILEKIASGELPKDYIDTTRIHNIFDLYKKAKAAVRELAQRVAAAGIPSIPTPEMFNRYDLRLELEGISLFIYHDGGDARRDKAYYPDGMTVRTGWVRFYWK